MSNYSKVQDFLRRCNLLEYYDRFISEGFDQLQSLLDVTESDLIAMDVKRGHRRRLQREIATAKGLPPNAPLYVQYGSGLEDPIDVHPSNNVHHPPPINSITQKILYINEPPRKSGETNVRSSQSTGENDNLDQAENGGVKRKYKRHPKRDKNAPRKPLSAYVMFAHRVREEYAGQNISFPDMAKIVGDRWKNVLPEVKEAIENEAAKKKEEYQAAMAVYKTTDSWKKYQEYLKEFKEKYESNSRDLNKRKRHKKKEASPDSDNTTPSGYSSTRSASIGCDNSSGSSSSGSSNGNGNGDGHHNHAQHNPTSSYSNNGYPPNSNNYIPPYSHYNPTVPYGFTSNNDRKNVSRTFLTPPSSINTSTPSTILADLYAKDDSNAGDDQSHGSRSGNGSSSGGSGGSSSSRRPNFEDSDNSASSSSDSTPSAVFMETDNNLQSQQQSQDQNQNLQDRSCQQENATK